MSKNDEIYWYSYIQWVCRLTPLYENEIWIIQWQERKKPSVSNNLTSTCFVSKKKEEYCFVVDASRRMREKKLVFASWCCLLSFRRSWHISQKHLLYSTISRCNVKEHHTYLFRVYYKKKEKKKEKNNRTVEGLRRCIEIKRCSFLFFWWEYKDGDNDSWLIDWCTTRLDSFGMDNDSLLDFN